MGPEPFFIERGCASLYATWVAAQGGKAAGCVLIIAPLGDEMNKSRRFLRLLSGGLAAGGFDVLHCDPTGTGDSSAEFEDATWAQWRGDILAAAAVLRARSAAKPFTVVALRAGALLADVLVTPGESSPDRLLFIQPVFNGAQWFRQWLRVRVTANRFAGIDESVDGLLAELQAGRGVEVAGYMVSPELGVPLEKARLAPAALAGADRIAVIEVLPAPRVEPPPALRTWLAGAAAGGVTTEYAAVTGESFWATQEITAPRGVVNHVIATMRAWAAADGR